MRHLSAFASTAPLLALSLAITGATVATAGAQAPAPKAAATASADQPIVTMKTSLGEIRIKLYKDKVPNTVNNFLGYVNDKFYDGTIFHRVIAGFMIQGGGFTADMTKKPTKGPIKLESQAGLSNKRGTVAMARTADPNSATAQFFINVVDNPGLDYPKPDGFGYAVFGEVVSGMDVVDKIKAVKTGQKNGMNDVPETPVVIESARVTAGS